MAEAQKKTIITLELSEEEARYLKTILAYHHYKTKGAQEFSDIYEAIPVTEFTYALDKEPLWRLVIQNNIVY